MAAQDLMGILSGKPIFVSILYMKANPVNLPKFMIFAYVSSAPACIMHSRDGHPYMLKHEGDVSARCNNGSTDITLNAVRYKPQECRDEQMDRCSSVKQFSKNCFPIGERSS